MYIILLPIEPLEERYSADWLDWSESYLANQDTVNPDFDWDIILPESRYTSIESGEFLDCIGTNKFKADQLSMTIDWIKENHDLLIERKDVVFWLHDGWFPGIEMLAYIRDSIGYSYKIAACLHAGTWDEQDFLSQKGMGIWGHSLEQSWMRIYDYIFVATRFHRDLLISKFRYIGQKIHITGFPICPLPQEVPVPKEDIVVFPHRLAPEKRPEAFLELARKAQEIPSLDRYTFIRTKDVCKTKAEYYSLLAKAKYSVSFALQETWGIAMQESVLLGCIPIVPDRLSYSEMYPSIFKMEDHAVLDKFIALEADPRRVTAPLKSLEENIIIAGFRAISNMLKVMYNKESYYDSPYIGDNK